MTTPNTSPGIDLDDTTRAELERAGVIVSKVDTLYNCCLLYTSDAADE